jgi:hypothetical protein
MTSKSKVESKVNKAVCVVIVNVSMAGLFPSGVMVDGEEHSENNFYNNFILKCFYQIPLTKIRILIFTKKNYLTIFFLQMF